jgi:nucleoside-diphosphate-sugar epimerase
LPLVAFRPQYIYGRKANKFDYLDWYFDRLVRELPLPIPSDGTQKVSLTNSEDVASLLASVLNNEEAAIQHRIFNCGTDQLYSYDEVAYMCAEAAGIARDDVSIEHYDSDLFGKATFPFRMTNFYVAPDKAKEVLGWEGPKKSLKEDLTWYYDSYKARGGPSKKLSLIKDWEIVVGSKTSFPEYVASIYEKYDPIVLDTSEAQPLKEA